MKPIPEDLIAAIPESVEATRESCMEAADTALYALFLMGAQLDPVPAFPLIVSNGVELYPLPAPWTAGEAPGTIRAAVDLLIQLNGTDSDPGYLAHVKRNAQEFNEALETNDIPLAQKIAAMGPVDSAAVWNDTNMLAKTAEKGKFNPLVLSAETKDAFQALTQRGPWLA